MNFAIHKPKRLTAALLHFCSSLIIFSLIFLVLINFWYPEPYFSSEGGWQGIKIVAAIDVVLGPALTLIVFNPSKSVRELSKDISVILAIQIAALAWGIYTMHNQRPVAVAFWNNSFITVTAQALAEQHYDISQLSAFSNQKPPLIYIQYPSKLDELKKLSKKILEQKIPPHGQPELYRPIKEHFAHIKAMRMNIEQLIAQDANAKTKLMSILAEKNSPLKDVVAIKLKSKYQDSILLFDQSANLLGYLDPIPE